MENENYRLEIGELIQSVRLERGLTQAELAEKLETSQSAINRIENGGQNISLEMLLRISDVLNYEIMSLNDEGKTDFRIFGGRELSGSIDVKTSKNAAVGLLCASLLNKGTTTLQRVSKIEEVYRLIEVLESIGVKTRWINDDRDLEIKPPKRISLNKMDIEAARRTRSVIMFMGPLLHRLKSFRLPYAGGCNLGERTVEPHLNALGHFGLSIDSKACSGFYDVTVRSTKNEAKRIILVERGDTVTENALMAAALFDGTTTIHGASSNYMVQDVCFFLQKLGVKIRGIGTTKLTVQGKPDINDDVAYSPSEDPIEAMSFIAASIVTNSEITVRRAPTDFLEIELETLKNMGLKYEVSREYTARNGHTKLADITIKKSELVAPVDKIHPMPFPGLNIDNLPFFGVIAAVAKGRTMLHDWVFENRAVYLTELTKLNANVQLLDAHRVFVEGPTSWRPADITAPPALRPSVVVLLAMLAAPGKSTLRDVYNINRGYEDFANRLNSLGARIETIVGI
jgi:UDP-N-acetylglucosamine 1-carboxyvinyltransferase